VQISSKVAIGGSVPAVPKVPGPQDHPSNAPFVT